MCDTVAVVGIGNILLRDEGVGVWVARALKKKPLAGNIRVIEGETAALDVFLSFPDTVKKVVIIDAVLGEGNPGTVYRIMPEDLASVQGVCVSLHQVGLFETLEIAKRTGEPVPRMVIIGVEPKEIGWGMGVTPEIEKTFPEIIDTVLKEVADDCDGKENPG
ncbi:hydrogenase maturation protease [Candidatus Latescibacterota bacterium]